MEVDLAQTIVTAVGEVPVRVVGAHAGSPRGLVVWLPPLGGSAAGCEQALRRLACAGFLAVSIDPLRHGMRADRRSKDLFAEVMEHFRATMWPILGGTVLDAMAVLDWAVERFGISGPILAGGISMGGDAALALAGADRRILRVAAIAATPDWTRPRMTLIGQPERPIDQGEGSVTGSWLRARLDPLLHTDRYRRRLDLRLDVGTCDSHVPGEAAHRFASELRSAGPEGQGRPEPRIDVVDHQGLDHSEMCHRHQILIEAIDWLVGRSPDRSPRRAGPPTAPVRSDGRT
ncbi:hypothetical protein C0Z10_06155 [Acidipropionibacterium jensenii]|uniref:Alpha/beta hydrolase n=1 Tax=Acidipropionibacterium jensenii TaxID=1749 RepID=A0A3T0RZ77_9ACTN|nr:hypothetical protein [Acidipropionibacterium jensenii]AZZ39398.1 hypothetical protein C0Z10_06155 [Acidipropionibacterium jensenii]